MALSLLQRGTSYVSSALRQRRARGALWGLLLAGAYFTAAKLGLALAFDAEQVTVIWPPAGIGLAAILVLGYRAWPAIALGAFLANATAHEPLFTALLIAAGNTLEAVGTVWLLRRFVRKGPIRFSRLREVFGLMVTLAIGCFIAATVGVTSLTLSGVQPGSHFGLLWLQWWFGDFTGALILAPLLVVWSDARFTQPAPLRLLEGSALAAAALLTALIVFTGNPNGGIFGHTFVYPIFLFVIWAGLRFGQRSTTLLTVMTSAISLWATWHELGPFVELSVTQSLVSLQVFMTLVAATSLLMSASTFERKRAEQETRESREWLQQIIDFGLDAVASVDQEGRIIHWNQQAEAIFGWSAEEAIDQPVDLIIPLIHRDMLYQEVLQFRREGASNLLNRRMEMEGLRRTGETFPVELTITAQRYRGRYQFTAFFRDLTEKRGAEKTRSLLAAIVASSDDAIISKTLDGVITSWNRGAERLYGYTPEEIVGKSVMTLIPPELHDEEVDILARLRRGERIEHYETIRLSKSREPLHVSLTISPIRDENGVIIGASKIARDITQQKRTEEALREADRRKNEFLATLAHELRNPLAPLSNALHIVQIPGVDAARRQEAMAIMQRQLQQMVRLVDDLLDVSRISHGKMELHKQRLTLQETIQQAIETARPIIEAGNHTLTVDVPETPFWLDGDSTRLAQIFSNLLNNAAKYTPQGGKIWLEAKAHGRQAEVRVRDTGIGIPSDMMPHIFDMFQQVDNSIERSHGGLGIGLTLVRTLTQMHGGTIEAKSEGPGRGSEFIVRLPLAEAPAMPNHSPSPKTNGATHTMRVLVVDDSQPLAMTLGWMVELMGHEVQVAYNAKGALDAARTFHPDVILLDIGLSGASGFDVCRQLRADPALKETIIIAQSGWSQEEHRRQSKEAGFNYHLAKPVEYDTLAKLFATFEPGSQEQKNGAH